MDDLIEKLRSVKWEVIDDDDWDSRCVFVDMRPDDFEALLTEAAAALSQPAEQRAEVEAMRKDAERYRWLRDGASEQIEGSDPWDSVGHIQPPLVCLKPGLQVYLAGHDLDAAIDAAMEKENKA